MRASKAAAPQPHAAASPTVARAPIAPAVSQHVAFQLIEPQGAQSAEEAAAGEAASAVVNGGSPYGVIVEDGLPAGEGQVNRTPFMDNLAPMIERAADELLRPAGRVARDCPYLDFWVGYYRGQSAAHIERTIAKYVRPEQTDREGIESAILEHVRTAVRAWVDRREVHVPGDVDWRIADDRVADAPADAAVAQRMGVHGYGAAAPAGSAAAIKAQLSDGRPLDSTVRTRMERGFGVSLGAVRIHTDDPAATLARRYSARAFAVGQDVAFAAGEYRPGSIAGDLLLAHEIAHTIQQRGAAVEAADGRDYELDATRAALGAVLPEFALALRSSLRSGLQLRRCGTGEEPAPQGVTEKEYAATIAELKTLYERRAKPDLTNDQKAEIDRRIRELTEKVWSWGVQISDEQLQRAVESGEDIRKRIGQEEPKAAPDTAAKSGTPANVAPKDVEMLDLTGITFKPPPSDSRVLLLWGNKHLYVLPARGLVHAAQPPPARQGQASGPVFGLPVAGHAGAYLVKTDQGVGMMVDAGGKRTGPPEVLMPPALEYLSVRMNIQRIDGGMLSHGHADHVANVPLLVQNNQLTGNIYVWPGWESATKGPMATVWSALRDPSFTQFGKGPNWQPTLLAAQQIPGPAGTTGVTRATLQVGDAQFEIITPTDKLRRYVQALQAGESGTKHADAGGKLIRITPVGARFQILIIGDWRGSYIKDLHQQMGDAAFTDFVKHTRVFGGMQHHLGAVNSKADVEGIRLLLKAIGPTAEPLTAAVQAGASYNAELVEALKQAGVRVVVLGEIDPAALGKTTFTHKGELRALRVSVHEAEPTIRAAQTRIVDLIRAAETLEKYPEEVRTVGKTAAEIATELRAEATRLRAAVDTRQELATSKLHSGTRVEDVDTRLQQNEQELKRVAGMETTLGEQIGVLARFRTRAEEIRAEKERARRMGESSKRLRQLIAEVHPQRAAEILAEELSAENLSKRGERRARRAARARLREQGRLSRLAEPGTPTFAGVGFRGGVAVVLIASEILHLAEPLIEEYVQEKKDEEYHDFYTFLQVASWWQERGASVPVVGLLGGKEVADAKAMFSGVKKRIWSDLPADRKIAEKDLDPEIGAATRLDQLYVPELINWKHSSLFWDSFRDWISSNVKNFDDYAAEFTDVDNPAIRMTSGPNFEEKLWQVRTGRIEGGHVKDVWQFSPDLTRIMQSMASRVVKGTEAKIEQEKARQSASSSGAQDSISSRVDTSDAAPRIGFPSSAATAIAHFKSDASRKGRGSYRFKETQPSPAWNKDENPEFLIYGSEAAPRDGFVLAGPGDYATYVRMRLIRVWTYDEHDSVKIQKKTVKPYETIPTEPVRTEREKYAVAMKEKGQGEFIAREGTVFIGEMRFPYYTPNEAALLWLRKEDLDMQPYKAPTPAPKQP